MNVDIKLVDDSLGGKGTVVINGPMTNSAWFECTYLDSHLTRVRYMDAKTGIVLLDINFI